MIDKDRELISHFTRNLLIVQSQLNKDPSIKNKNQIEYAVENEDKRIFNLEKIE